MVLRLGDVATLPVETRPLESGVWAASSPHWPGHEAYGATEESAVSNLQYALEFELAHGRAPVLELSP